MTTTLEQAAARLDRIPDRVRARVARDVAALGKRGERYAKEGLLSGTRLRVRSGRLRGSIATALDEEADAVTLRLIAGAGTRPIRYAAQREYGGTVVPVRAKMLAIPLAPALTPAGVQKMAPRDLVGGFVWRTHTGRLVLGRREGKRGRPIAYFLLVRSVTQQGAFYLRDTMDLMRQAAPEVLRNAVDAELRGVFSGP